MQHLEVSGAIRPI